MPPTNEDWQNLLLKVQRLESQLRRRREHLVLLTVLGLLLTGALFAVSEIQASGPGTQPTTQATLHQTLRTENLQIVDRHGRVLIEFDAKESNPRMLFKNSDDEMRAVLIVKRGGDGGDHAMFFLGDGKSMVGLVGPREGWIAPALQIADWGGKKRMEMRVGDGQPWFAITDEEGDKSAVWPKKE